MKHKFIDWLLQNGPLKDSKSPYTENDLQFYDEIMEIFESRKHLGIESEDLEIIIKEEKKKPSIGILKILSTLIEYNPNLEIFTLKNNKTAQDYVFTNSNFQNFVSILNLQEYYLNN